MNVKKLYDGIDLRICDCKSGKRYFDPFRNKFVCITPEENVRQKTCIIMAKKFGTPKEVIKVEDHLMHYGVMDKKGRIDISISFIDKRGTKKPLAVIECKEGRVPIIAQQVIDQAGEYAAYIGAAYFIVTNGIEMNYYRYDKNGTYQAINALTYRDMLTSKYTIAKSSSVFTRLPYSEYYKVERLKRNKRISDKIGEDTDEELIPTIINLYDCLSDLSRRIEKLPTKRYKIIDDLGKQYRKYNDASGGCFGSGEYRVMRLLDRETNKEFLAGFSVTTTGKTVNHPKYGTSDGKSVLVIMINDGDRDEMSVQINMNKCIIVNGNMSTITHNALISKKGKSKRGLLEYIESRNKKLVAGNKIVLGTLDCSKSLYMNSDDVSMFIANAIEYAVYRNEYKNS